MATQKGTHITNFDASPVVAADSRLHGGVVRYYGDQFELTDTANADNAIVLALPIDATAIHFYFASDDLGTAGTVNLGFFTKNRDGSYTAVDGDAIAAAIDVNASAVSRTDYRFSAKGIETANQPLWQLAGLSARPDYDTIYFGLETPTGTTADGTVLLQAVVSL